MRLLLDTHVFLWWVNADARLSEPIRSKILNANEVYVSSASIWEAVIKKKLNKLDVDLDSLVPAVAASGFLELPITAQHARQVAELPDIHRDPFDRILIAQAISEPLVLFTMDSALQPYSELVHVMNSR